VKYIGLCLGSWLSLISIPFHIRYSFVHDWSERGVLSSAVDNGVLYLPPLQPKITINTCLSPRIEDYPRIPAKSTRIETKSHDLDREGNVLHQHHNHNIPAQHSSTYSTITTQHESALVQNQPPYRAITQEIPLYTNTPYFISRFDGMGRCNKGTRSLPATSQHANFTIRGTKNQRGIEKPCRQRNLVSNSH
jgi:hypothetical protein